MNPALTRKLIEKGAIREGTIVEAYYKAHGISGLSDSLILERFTLKNATVTKDGIVNLYAVGGSQNTLKKFSCTEIVRFDGMDEQRISRTYDMTLEGESEILGGKRRGRRKNSELV